MTNKLLRDSAKHALSCSGVFGCTDLHKSRSVPGASLLNLGSIVGAPCMPIVATVDPVVVDGKGVIRAVRS